MPAISGSDLALMFAQFGVMRFGASRFGYTSAHVFISINAVQRRANVQYDTLSITDELDESPNTCQFTVVGFTPTVGMEVIVTLGSTHNAARLFAGHILQVKQTQQWLNGQVFYHVSCIDYTWLLNRQKVIKHYTSSSATTIATDLIQTYATGFTARNVITGLATVDEITFTNEDLPAALTRLAKRIGAYWRVDYDKDLHFGVSETAADPVNLTASHVSVSDIIYDTDLSQVITRVIVEGGGLNTIAACAPGETILPVEDVSWYSSSGGTLVSGAQRITYSGLDEGGDGSLVGTGVTPSAALTPSIVSGSGIEDGLHQYAYTWVTAAGETLPSPLASVTCGSDATISAPTITDGAAGSLTVGAIYKWRITNMTGSIESGASPASADFTVPASGEARVAFSLGPSGTTTRKLYRTLANGSTYYFRWTIPENVTTVLYDSTADGVISGNPTLGGNQVSITGVAVGPATTTSRKIYRTVAGGSQLKLQQTIANNTATAGVTDSTADAALTTNVPTSDTSGLTQPTGQVNPGSTSIVVAGTAFASATGGWAIIGNGQQVIRYTGFSNGSLTGIPAAGIGQILAAVAYNSTITAAPALIGIPASGVGAILYTIRNGDPVNVLVIVDDAAAQSSLATLIGGGDDGIQEEYVQDRRLSEAECTLRGEAILTLRNAAESRLRYRCRDPRTRTGLTITFSFAGTMNISGAYKIQTVTISQFSATATQYPTYTVEASSTKFTLDSLLGMIREQRQVA